jgi:hypothetical protein
MWISQMRLGCVIFGRKENLQQKDVITLGNSKENQSQASPAGEIELQL